MKSKGAVYIVFFLFCLNANAKDYKKIMPSTYSEVQVDSLYSTFTKDIPHQNAEAVINWFESEQEHRPLSNEGLRKLAISYAMLDAKQEAVEYAEKYIKQSHSIEIIDSGAFQNLKGYSAYETIVQNYKPKLNAWILFFFSTGLIGVFIAITINLRKKGDRVANLLISSFVFFHSLFVFYVCLFLSNYIYEFPHTLRVTTSFSFLYGPLLYFYFKRISEKYKFKIADVLHLVPSIVLILFSLPIYTASYDQKLHLLYNKGELLQGGLNTIILLKSISLMTYGYLIYSVYKKSLIKQPKSDREILKWKKNILILHAIYVISYMFYGATLIKMTPYGFRYPLIFALCIIVLYVAYTAYVQPRVFSKKYLFDEFLKYQKSGLTDSFSNDLKEQLLRLLNEEKIYKTSTISLDALSNSLGTTRHNISQVINEHFDMNFFNLINKYRIREAMRIFQDDYNHSLNIIDVAYDVGFNNKVTFNKAFKEETKLTPSQYIKDLHGKHLATSA